MKLNLYTFNFIPEGFNQVRAMNIVEAKGKAHSEFGRILLIDDKSFKRVDDEAAYYASFPLMD